MIGILCQHRSGHSAYEQYLKNKTGLETLPELDINQKNAQDYFVDLPTDGIFSMMPFDNCYDYMKKYNNIDWQIFLRKDVVTQCLSFIYTNKTGIIRNNQSSVEVVDEKLIQYFYNNWTIINDVVNKNEYPVYYYEDFYMPNLSIQKNNNDYRKLIKNIDSVLEKIDQLSFTFGT